MFLSEVREAFTSEDTQTVFPLVKMYLLLGLPLSDPMGSVISCCSRWRIKFQINQERLFKLLLPI